MTASAESAQALAASSQAMRFDRAGVRKIDNDAALTSRVRDVASRLIAEVGAFRPDALRWRWQVDVIDADALNAFCLPGGRIGVSSGLVRRLDLSDAELAAVLGHEIAHALREHTREKASQQELMQAVVQGVALFGGRGAALQSVAAEAGSHYLVALPFSRTMESEADLIGLELMARAGYDPRLASGVWKKLMALPEAASVSGSGRALAFLSTHPGDAQRLDAIDVAVPKVVALYEAREVKRAATLHTDDAAAVASQRQSLERVSPAARAVGEAKVVVGQDARQVERLARAAACNVEPLAALVDKGPGFETYVVACSSGAVLTFRCEYGQCRAAAGGG